jgi:hypothetical protein
VVVCGERKQPQKNQHQQLRILWQVVNNSKRKIWKIFSHSLITTFDEATHRLWCRASHIFQQFDLSSAK